MEKRQNVYERKAYAKINLGLDVLGRLPNGYHQVKMVMQTVGIYDVLTLERAESGVTLTTDSDELSTGGDNLICKAAQLMLERYEIDGGVRIHLQKNIPIAAGMAGGSTDAAATLKGIDQMYGLGCSQEELMELGVLLGADVPYCIMGGTALAEGIGEKLTRLCQAPDCALLVAKPDINVFTGQVYRQLDELADYAHPDIDGMVEAIRAGNLQGVIDRLGNVLENVTLPAYPVIDVIKRRMLELGAAGSLMSGSGPTVFGMFTDRKKAEEAGRLIKEEGLAGKVFLTGFREA
ncbi:MAG: 4-(cytidine 5'-diphospho)-2-C-methyl-D-erythritol kinase [Candidatus Gastranaerophilales bacterium]|nr:4-(cytidine 5'-diphospho)-2-C-methyl-D-erythritol kinase [Candidatus Gastranaerophilales bacterium]